MSPRVPLVSHPSCLLHDTGPHHADGSWRLPALIDAVRADPDLVAVVEERLATPASEEDLLRVHPAAHLALVREAARLARRQGGLVWLDGDTPVSGASWEAALAAAGCAITAAEAVLDGDPSTAFALSRPPGHHATRDRAMGFCLFNNAAVAARRVQASGAVEKVLVLDWDAHHGNGTQDIFYDDPSVYVLSLHLSPEYPGTGHAAERGTGPGHGTTLNVPLSTGTAPDEYRSCFLDSLEGVLSSFEPEGFVLISAGFDCLQGDPEGGFLLGPRDLHRLTLDLLGQLPAVTRRRVVGVLEGGYAVERIGGGLVAMLRAFGGLPAVD